MEGDAVKKKCPECGSKRVAKAKGREATYRGRFACLDCWHRWGWTEVQMIAPREPEPLEGR